MDIYGQVIILGALQGLTEFFPVSSSGHLMLAQHFMGMRGAGVFLDLILHVGTLGAVLLFLRREIWLILYSIWAGGEEGRKGRRLLLLLIVASLPTALLGLAFRSVFISMFHSVAVVGSALVLTALLLLLTRLCPSKKNLDIDAVPWRLALLVGVAQGLAITPGLSRSGATISVALLLGVNRDLAFRFSFLLSIPAIIGAVALESANLGDISAGADGMTAGALFLGALVAGLCGLGALSLLNRLIKKDCLYGFFPYCLILGLIALIAG
ncbi:MAG: undecaprenyl-diphosphate phosphatase [Desulfarculales bacterium]|nr:undecaprenyl-diphosphate phosphatase [Desulfarculales bacterium]